VDCSTKKRKSEVTKNKDKKTVIVEIKIVNKKVKRLRKNEQEQKVQSVWQKFWTYFFGVQSRYWSL
jgi:hypothetical protein